MITIALVIAVGVAVVVLVHVIGAAFD